MNADKGRNNKKRARKAAGRTTAVVILSAILSAVSGLTAFGLISYSGYVIYDSIYTNKAAFSSFDLSGYRPSVDDEGEPAFDELKKVNPDTVGWIKISGTNIDYPVVQGKDDLEYATKDVFGNNSLTGAIYLTAANTRDFTNSYNLIYGHHMDNGAMFGDIEKYEDESFFNNNRNGYLVTTQGAYDINIFARINTDAYDGMVFSPGDKSEGEIPDLLNYVKSLSINWQDGADIGALTQRVGTYLRARENLMSENGRFALNMLPDKAVSDGTQILALSTCADATTNGRQLLFATMSVRTEPIPEDMLLDDSSVPLAILGHGGDAYWGLINLICVLICLILMLPGRKTRDKYRRFKEENSTRSDKEHSDVSVPAASASGAAGQESPGSDREDARQRDLRRRRKVMLLIEVLLVILSVLIFMLTENLRNRMTILDKWTPLMLILTAAVIWIDIRLFARRTREEEEPEYEQEALKPAAENI